MRNCSNSGGTGHVGWLICPSRLEMKAAVLGMLKDEQVSGVPNTVLLSDVLRHSEFRLMRFGLSAGVG